MAIAEAPLLPMGLIAGMQGCLDGQCCRQGDSQRAGFGALLAAYDPVPLWPESCISSGVPTSAPTE